MPTEIETFFASYINGYDDFDAIKIASHYTVPCVVLDSTGIETFTDTEALVAKMAVYCDGFKQAGYKKARFVCEQYVSLGEHACFVDLHWKIELEGRELEYKTAYIIHLTQDVWKINNATVYGY
ncbi:MAG: hypothetical protein AB8G18_04055 [Gammaproteobacteria bacterium]